MNYIHNYNIIFPTDNPFKCDCELNSSSGNGNQLREHLLDRENNSKNPRNNSRITQNILLDNKEYSTITKEEYRILYDNLNN